MVSPQAKREGVRILMSEHDFGVTRACGLVQISRSLFRYCVRRSDRPELLERIEEIAALKRRYGYRRVYLRLRREGWAVNRKRVYRIYREAGLAVRRRKRKRIGAVERKPLPKPVAANLSWSMDFVSDGLADGRRLRCLTVVDDCTRECLAIEVDTSITGTRVKQVMNRLAESRGLPRSITVDNGPEFQGQVLDAWAYQANVALSFIRPGKPNENAYIESFNGKFRDECLNEHWFITMAQARRVIELWRIEYNTERPHSSIGNITPEEYAENLMAQTNDLTLLSAADSRSERD
jgi:putative transposase